MSRVVSSRRMLTCRGLCYVDFDFNKATKGDLGCLPFVRKIRKFRFEVKRKAIFPENLFGNCGQPPEVVLFFRSEQNSGNFLTICANRSISRSLLTRFFVFQYGVVISICLLSSLTVEDMLNHTCCNLPVNGKEPFWFPVL